LSGMLRNSSMSFVAGLCFSLGSLGSSILVARLLGVETSGSVAFTLWLVFVVSTVCDLGSNSALTRFLPELAVTHPGSGDDLARWLFRPIALVTLAVTAGIVAYGVSSAHPGTPSIYYYLAAALCLATTCNGFVTGYLKGMQRFGVLARIVIASTVIQLAAVGIGASLGGLNGALAGYLAGVAVPALWTVRFVRSRALIPAETRRRVKVYAFYTWLAGMTSTLVWSRLEIWFLHQYQGDWAVGSFAAALTLSTLATQVPVLLTGAVLPYLAQKQGEQADASVHDTLDTGTRLLALLLFPLCFGAAGVAKELLPLLFGHAFDSAVPAAQILLIVSAFTSTATIQTQVVYAKERSDFVVLSGGVCGVLSLCLAWALVPTYGLIGAALSRAAAQILGAAWGAVFVVRTLRCRLPFAAVANTALAALFCAVAANAVLTFAGGVLGLALAIATGAAVYVSSVAALGVLAPGDMARLNTVAHELVGRQMGRARPYEQPHS
jgi:O-antigen/teichoic acid export membrane protein